MIALNQIKIAVLLVLYNDEENLAPLVDSLKNQSSQDFGILAIECSSSGKSAMMLNQLYPEADIYPSLGNLGYGKGNNFLFARARDKNFEYALVVNSDTILHKDFLLELSAVLDRNIKASACSPLVFTGTPEITHFNIQNYREHYDYKNGNVISLDVSLPEIEKLPETEETGAVNGCACLYRIDCFKTELLFCEENFMYGEEMDLSYRINKKGHQCFATRRAMIWHNHKWNASRQGDRTRSYYMARNRFLFFRRYKKHQWFFRYMLLELLYSPVKVFWSLKKNDMLLFFYYYKGVVHGIWGISGKIF
jgi:GT2 family glycosyltransferase